MKQLHQAGSRGLLLALLLVAISGAAAFVCLPTPAARVARPPVVPATSGRWAPQSIASSLPASQQQRRDRRGQQQARPSRTGLQAAAAAGGNDLKEKLLVAIRSLYFPASVLGAGLLGAWKPALYAGLSEGFVTRALAAVMVRACVHGLALTDSTAVI